MCAYISSFFPPLFLLSATWIGGRLGLKELVTFFFFCQNSWVCGVLKHMSG